MSTVAENHVIVRTQRRRREGGEGEGVGGRVGAGGA